MDVRSKPALERENAPNAAPTVTLLICTSGRSRLLEGCLTAIVKGVDLPEQLVVVNGSDGRTPAVVERFATAFPEVTLVEHPNRNLATLRNLGLPHCTGDIVAMTDDDAVPDPGWIQALRSSHERRPSVGAVGGAVRGLSNDFLSRLADAVVFPDPHPRRPVHTLPTVNMSYKATALEAAGEFDDALFRGEDVDYNWRVIQSGYDIVFEPSMRVRHQHRTTLWGLYQQQYMYGRAYVLVRRKWPDMYSVYPHSFRTPRSWVKLAYCMGAIVFMPLGIARRLATRDRVRAYPVLIIHHLVWKAGMLRQVMSKGAQTPESLEQPSVIRWRSGVRSP